MSSSTTANTTKQGEFRKELGLFDSTMIVIGSMIGSGIFIVSADIARTMGCGGWLLGVWALAGVLTVAAALTFGELAAMMPHAGGQYVFLREAYGPLFGFLYGWTLCLVIQTGTIAAVAVAFAKFTGVLIPWFSEKHVLFEALGRPVTGAQVLAIASIVVLTAVNLRGLREGKAVQNFFTSIKTLLLVGLIVVALTAGADTSVWEANVAGMWDASWTVTTTGSAPSTTPLSGLMLFVAMGVAMVGSLFACDAWNNLTFTAGEVKKPQRDIPLSLVLGTGIVTLLYVLANVGYLHVLPLHGDAAAPLTDPLARGIQFAANDRVGTATASAILGAKAESLMAILIMLSTFGCNNGLILAGARVTYAVARDRLFFASVGRLNEHGVPGVALVLQGIWAGLLCLSGTYGDLLDYVVFAVLLFGILTVAAVYVLRARRPEAPRPYRAWGYPVVPALYIVPAVLICLDLFFQKPMYTWPGIGIVLAGVPVFYLWRARVPAECPSTDSKS